MQFSCESCKAQLQIADEKIRGKRLDRLFVRCRRCGAKIGLADSLLANSSARVVERFPAPGPMRISPRPDPGRQQTDDESTRAMDSDVLERALQASKADDVSRNGSPATQKLHFPRPAVPPEDVEWFAMIRGKQAGPLTRDELIARANEGDVGPRTYLWREGMDAWQRAVDVPDLFEMFPQLPPPPSRPPVQTASIAVLPHPPEPRPVASAEPPAAAAPAEPATATDAVDLPRGAGELPQQEAPAEAGSAQAQLPAPQRISSPLLERRTPLFESAAPAERGPFTVFLGLMALAAAAIVLWIVLAGSPVAPSPVPPAAPADPQPEAVQPAQVSPGLTADQVDRKLDENKPALQGCITEALGRDPSLRVGKIHVSTTIAPSGQVTAARIDQPSVDESPLGACLKSATRRIVFPQFSGPAFDVDIPIVVAAGQ